MAGRILGIEIGSKITRVVEMDYGKKLSKIHNYCCFETPEQVFDDGNVSISDDFVYLLKEELKRNRIHTTKVIFCINSSRVAAREVYVPAVKHNRIREVVMANASEYFPVDLGEYELGIRVMDTVEQDGKKQHHLSLMALPKVVAHRYQQLAKAADLTLEALDFSGNSMVHAVLSEKKEGLNAYVKIDEDSTMVVIAEDDEIKLQRTVKYGLQDAIEVIRGSEVYGIELTFQRAMEMMHKETCLRKYLHSDEEYVQGEDTEIAKIQIEATRTLEPLISNVERILTYYSSHNDNKLMNNIYLMGLGASVGGLGKLMGNELGYTVLPVQNPSGVSIAQFRHREPFYAAEFVTCIAAAVEPAFPGAVGKKGEEGEKAESSLLIPGLFCGILLVVAALMAAVPSIQRMQLKSEGVKLEAEKTAYLPVQAEYDSMIQAQQRLNVTQQMWDATVTSNERLVAFLEELEDKMPSEIQTLTLSADGTSVTLNVQVASKNSAAKVLSQLRTFSSITVDPSTYQVDETVDEVGKHSVSFTVECLCLPDPVTSTTDGEDGTTTDDQGTAEDQDTTVEE